ncbi:hypothetical protein QFZ64_000024 [Streptomyces sp. B3I8]|nr:hypothetical protein [Streptomyces sp. B3I8]
MPFGSSSCFASPCPRLVSTHTCRWSPPTRSSQGIEPPSNSERFSVSTVGCLDVTTVGYSVWSGPLKPARARQASLLAEGPALGFALVGEVAVGDPAGHARVFVGDVPPDARPAVRTRYPLVQHTAVVVEAVVLVTDPNDRGAGSWRAVNPDSIGCEVSALQRSSRAVVRLTSSRKGTVRGSCCPRCERECTKSHCNGRNHTASRPVPHSYKAPISMKCHSVGRCAAHYMLPRGHVHCHVFDARRIAAQFAGCQEDEPLGRCVGGRDEAGMPAPPEGRCALGLPDPAAVV